MKGSSIDLSIEKLLRVYGLKLIVAEKRHNDKKKDIENTRLELLTRQQTVSDLQIKTNDVFSSFESSGSNIDANQLHQAHRYRYWLDYEMQRQQFYLDLTKEEYREKLTELHVIRSTMAKLNAKMDVLHKYLSTLKIRKFANKERVMIEEYESAFFTRRTR